MIAYFDCFSGISGDMTLGAFIDAGVDPDWLRRTLKVHLLEGFDLTVSQTSRHGISAKKVEVVSLDKSERNYADIVRLIEASSLPERAKILSLSMFDKVAEAEGAIHNRPRETVHFHELGGIDAIIDIVGTALCVDHLNIESVSASRLPLGSGFVQCAHGCLPVPAPATLAILKDVPVYDPGVAGEMVTPTGAAIIKTLADHFGPMPDMVIRNTGYGSGSADFKERPNLLRIVLGEPLLSADTVSVIETCIDDMNPEIFGFLMERLFEDGALDVCYMPVFMKKNRPATLVQVLSPLHLKEALIRRILSETTTLGVRHHEVNRRILEREIITVETEWGIVSVKKIRGPGGGWRLVPEYETCAEIARQQNLPIRQIYERVSRQAESGRK